MVCMLLHELTLKGQSRGGHAHKPHQFKEIFQSSAVLDFELHVSIWFKTHQN